MTRTREERRMRLFSFRPYTCECPKCGEFDHVMGGSACKACGTRPMAIKCYFEQEQDLDMLDQLAIVRKHALVVWKSPRDSVRKTLGAIHAAAAVAYDEIEALPKSPIAVILGIIQIIHLISWLIGFVWPRRPPQEIDEDELEQMLARLSA